MTAVHVRYRGAFAYVDGELAGGERLPLMRLRYGGSAHRWGTAIYMASTDSYQNQIWFSDQRWPMISNALHRGGHRLTRDALAARLREDGHSVRNSRLTPLLQALRSDSASRPGPAAAAQFAPARAYGAECQPQYLTKPRGGLDPRGGIQSDGVADGVPDGPGDLGRAGVDDHGT